MRGLALQHPDSSGLLIQKRHAHRTCSIGGSRNAVSVCSKSVCAQTNAQAQRNCSLLALRERKLTIRNTQQASHKHRHVIIRGTR